MDNWGQRVMVVTFWGGSTDFMKEVISRNPAENFKILGKVPTSRERQIQVAVSNASAAKQDWKRIGVSHRLKHLENLYKSFEENRAKIAKPITQTYGEMDFFNLLIGGCLIMPLIFLRTK